MPAPRPSLTIVWRDSGAALVSAESENTEMMARYSRSDCHRSVGFRSRPEAEVSLQSRPSQWRTRAWAIIIWPDLSIQPQPQSEVTPLEPISANPRLYVSHIRDWKSLSNSCKV